MYSNSLPVNEKYIDLPRSISINILDFSLFKDSNEFHSEFRALEAIRHTQLSDKFVLHFFELPKIPEEIGKNDLLLLWLSLFKAKTLEELNRIDGLGVPELSEAVGAYHTVTASPEYQELERLRIKAGHDEAQKVYNAEMRGEKRGKKLGKELGIKLGEEQSDAKWQSIVADKDAEITKPKKMLENNQ